MAHKRALIVGINYVGTGNDLGGCINDAHNVRALISEHYGFTDIRVLLETEATTDAIKNGLRWLVSGCRPGDVLFFHYSGHGSQIPDTSDPDDEPDELDEIICPYDLNWEDKIITDDYMKWVFDTVPAGVNLTVVLDCCHSGGALDQVNQYQPSITMPAYEYQPNVVVIPLSGNSRYLTPPDNVQELIDALKVQSKERSVQSTRQIDQTGLLISGCRSNQTSADAKIDGQQQGAATHAMLSALKKANHKISYKELVDEMNQSLANRGFAQRPELNGSSNLFSTEFLAPPTVSQEVLDAYVPVDLPPVPATTQNTEQVLTTITETTKKQNNPLYFVAAGVVLAILLAIIFLA